MIECGQHGRSEVGGIVVMGVVRVDHVRLDESRPPVGRRPVEADRRLAGPGRRRTGVVTSGTQSPTLGRPIAMAYVAPGDDEPGTILTVEIRDQPVDAEVTPLPFYRRAR